MSSLQKYTMSQKKVGHFYFFDNFGKSGTIFRLEALALSVIATATWLGGCHTPVLYQNR